MKKLDNVQYKTPIPLKDALLVVKVGSDERPASSEDLESIRIRLQEALGDFEGARVFVTHHAINFETLDLKGLKNVGKETEKATTRRRKKVVNAILELGN